MAETLGKEEIKIGTGIGKTGKKAESENPGLTRIGVSLPLNLLKRFEKIIRGRGYSSRSEGIRDAIRAYIIEYIWTEQESGKKIGTITYIYDHNQTGLRRKLEKIENNFRDIIKESSRVPADNKSYFAIIAVEGNTKRIKELAERTMSRNGVKSVKLTTH